MFASGFPLATLFLLCAAILLTCLVILVSFALLPSPWLRRGIGFASVWWFSLFSFSLAIQCFLPASAQALVWPAVWFVLFSLAGANFGSYNCVSRTPSMFLSFSLMAFQILSGCLSFLTNLVVVAVCSAPLTVVPVLFWLTLFRPTLAFGPVWFFLLQGF